MTIERPDIRMVVPPTDEYGVAKGGKPRMRHLDGDCGHFNWGTETFGEPRMATEEEMRTLPACKDCKRRSNDAKRSGRTATSTRNRPPGRPCPTCRVELPATGVCDDCG